MQSMLNILDGKVVLLRSKKLAITAPPLLETELIKEIKIVMHDGALAP